MSYLIVPSKLLGREKDLTVWYHNEGLLDFRVGEQPASSNHIMTISPFLTPSVAHWIIRQRATCRFLPLQGPSQLLPMDDADEFGPTLLTIGLGVYKLLGAYPGFRRTHIGDCAPEKLSGLLWCLSPQPRGLILWPGHMVETTSTNGGVDLVVDRYVIHVQLTTTLGIQKITISTRTQSYTTLRDNSADIFT